MQSQTQAVKPTTTTTTLDNSKLKDMQILDDMNWVIDSSVAALVCCGYDAAELLKDHIQSACKATISLVLCTSTHYRGILIIIRVSYIL